MQSTQTFQVPERLRVAVVLSRLMARLEVQGQMGGGEQYRSVVRHLVDELDHLCADEQLPSLLQAFPATAELYENMRYEVAGLCRSPLEASLQAELAACALIAKVGRLPVA